MLDQVLTFTLSLSSTYADDVGDALLTVIMDAGALLVEGEGKSLEALPGVSSENALKPGRRVKIGRDVAGLSNESYYGKSNLMRLNEYYCIYLLAWSDTLWPPDVTGAGGKPELGVASFDDLFPATSFHESAAADTDDPATYLYYLDEKQQQVNVEPKDIIVSTFEPERGRVKTFRDTLPKVRRTLANVPAT